MEAAGVENVARVAAINKARTRHPDLLGLLRNKIMSVWQGNSANWKQPFTEARLICLLLDCHQELDAKMDVGAEQLLCFSSGSALGQPSQIWIVGGNGDVYGNLISDWLVFEFSLPLVNFRVAVGESDTTSPAMLAPRDLDQ